MYEQIKKIYLGLPNELVGKVYWVEAKFRTNSLSKIWGGSDVVVEYHSGKIIGYDNVKFPSEYISSILTVAILKDYQGFKIMSKEDRILIIKNKVSRIFARRCENGNFIDLRFEEVWNSLKSNNLPWEDLKRFDSKPELEKIFKPEGLDLDYREETGIKSPININVEETIRLESWFDNLEESWKKLLYNNLHTQHFKIENGISLSIKMLETLIMNDDDLSKIKTIEPLKELGAIKYLKIIKGSNNLLFRTKLDFLRYLPNLQYLEIQSLDDSRFLINGLEYCSQLLGIRLTSCNILGYGSLKYLKNLRFLDLKKSNLYPEKDFEKIIEYFINLSNLKSICLCETNILKIIKTVSNCPGNLQFSNLTHASNYDIVNTNISDFKYLFE